MPEPTPSSGRRILLDMPGGQLHARVAGAGPPLVLLHASPLSSEFMAGHIMHLARHFTCIAIDTPGYGYSDPLPAPAHSLDAYAAAIFAGMTNYGLAAAAVYGTATGAQIALAMARTAPQRVTQLVLDNCAAFAADWRAANAANYFADLTPTADGSAWQRTWTMADRQFKAFPWYSEDAADQLNRPAPPPAFVHAMALAFASARPGYDAAYRLAFEAEDIASFAGLDLPTTLIDWHGSIVRAQVADLISQKLPACVTVMQAGPSLAERLAAITSALQGNLHS